MIYKTSISLRLISSSVAAEPEAIFQGQ